MEIEAEDRAGNVERVLLEREVKVVNERSGIQVAIEEEETVKNAEGVAKIDKVEIDIET